jgi:PhnB protein
MSKVSTYLNFPRTAEAAFMFYKDVFGTEFVAEIHRMGEVPAQPGKPELSAEDKNLVMHVGLPTLGGHIIYGTDAPESMGFTVVPGNNMYINLEPDTRAETEKLFNGLAEGGKIETPLQVMFWGDYYGSLTDKFGITWMFNCSEKV